LTVAGSSTPAAPAAPAILFVVHSRSGGTARLCDAAVAGARDAVDGGVEIVVREALDATADEVVAAAGIVLATPANFGYMSGGMKEFFDRNFSACVDLTVGRPYALIVKATTDGSGAVQSVERIVAGLQWRAIAPATVVMGEISVDHLAAVGEVGATMAAGLEAGIF
jgi:multimeric flavodoxin WrbA